MKRFVIISLLILIAIFAGAGLFVTQSEKSDTPTNEGFTERIAEYTQKIPQLLGIQKAPVDYTFCPGFNIDLAPGDKDMPDMRSTTAVPVGEVSNLQRFLLAEGMWFWSVNGSFDEDTENAVIEWKQKNNFASDSADTASFVGPRTREAMRIVAEHNQTCEKYLQPKCVYEVDYCPPGTEEDGSLTCRGQVGTLYTHTFLGPLGYESSIMPDAPSAKLVHEGACTENDAAKYNAEIGNTIYYIL